MKVIALTIILSSVMMRIEMDYMTRKKERKRAHETITANTWIQLKSSFVVWFMISSADSVKKRPKQMLFVIALKKSRTAHLSKGNLCCENWLKISWPTTDIMHENDVICPTIV